MIQMEELYEKILAELDLSKEVEDDELVEIIHRTLEEKGKESYIPLKQKSGLGKELFNTFRKLDILQELIEDDEITEITDWCRTSSDISTFTKSVGEVHGVIFPSIIPTFPVVLCIRKFGILIGVT